MKSKLVAGFVLAAAMYGGQAAAQATTYTFTSPLYATTTPAASCTVGECATYTTAQRAVITLTFAAPLAANLPIGDRSGDLTAYTMNDGVRTTTGPGANAASFLVRIGTDPTGLPNNYLLFIERTPGPPYTDNTPTDPNARVSGVQMAPAATDVQNNLICILRGGSGGAVTGPGSCDLANGDGSSSAASTGAPVVTLGPPGGGPAAVPTLSEWAMILFGTILAAGAALHLQRRRHFDPA